MKKLFALLLSLSLCATTAAFVGGCKDTEDSTGSFSSESGSESSAAQANTAEELIAAIAAGGKVKLGANVQLSTPLRVEEGVSATIDLNGKTLSAALKQEGKHHYAIDNYGTLTLKGSGTISARGIENFGTMTVEEGVNIESIDENGGAAIWNEGTLTVNGGTFKAPFVGSSSDVSGPGCLNNNGGTVTIVNGTFESNNLRTYAIISSGGSIRIENATVKGAQGAVGISSGTAEILGGTFHSTQHYGLYVYSGTATVKGGTFTGDRYSVDVYVEDGATVVLEGGTLTNDGIHGNVTDNRSLNE